MKSWTKHFGWRLWLFDSCKTSGASLPHSLPLSFSVFSLSLSLFSFTLAFYAVCEAARKIVAKCSFPRFWHSVTNCNHRGKTAAITTTTATKRSRYVESEREREREEGREREGEKEKKWGDRGEREERGGGWWEIGGNVSLLFFFLHSEPTPTASVNGGISDEAQKQQNQFCQLASAVKCANLDHLFIYLAQILKRGGVRHLSFFFFCFLLILCCLLVVLWFYWYPFCDTRVAYYCESPFPITQTGEQATCCTWRYSVWPVVRFVFIVTLLCPYQFLCLLCV